MFGASSEDHAHDEAAFKARVAEAKDRVARSQMNASELAIVRLLSIGTVLSLIGLYFLLMPSGGGVELMGRTVEVANIHSLYIGQTSSIIGAMFLVAGLRPR